MPSWLYILRLKSGSLYVGATTNLKKRFGDHCSGKACRTTKFDPPVDIVYTETFESLSGARNREALVSGQKRSPHSRRYCKAQRISKITRKVS